MLLWFASPKSSVKPESVHPSRTPCASASIIFKYLEYQRDMIKRLIPTFRHRTTLLAVSLASTFSLPALAQDDVVACEDLNLPNPIYGSGGSAITATLAKVATALAGLDEPITILFADPGACTGFQAFLDGNATTNFKYWNAKGEQLSCSPPAVGGIEPAFAHMGNPAEDCAGLTLPDDVGDFLAPVQTLNLITSIDSSETSISREAAYFIYGWGNESEAPPWTNASALARRRTDSFVHNFLATAIGLPAGNFIGTEGGTQQDIVEHIVRAAATDPDSTLGYVSGSAANNKDNRQLIKTLAYQHTGQECGYWPSSGPDSFDAINVRKGLYHFWTPGHFFAKVDEKGKPTDANVAEFLGWFQGSLQAPGGVDVTKIIIESGDIPGCAMQATREGITGPVSSYAPDAPCGCYFDYVATGKTSCDTCEKTSDCSGSETCRNGFCEAY